MADNLSGVELGWLAGLLEGEGCFSQRRNHNPLIQLYMTDADTVIKAAGLMGSHKVIEVKHATRAGKILYRTTVYGISAIVIMRLIYPQMSERRKAKIDLCIKDFESKRLHIKKYKERTPYSRGAKIVWFNPVNIAL